MIDAGGSGGMPSADFVAMIKREAAAYTAIVQKANIRPE